MKIAFNTPARQRLVAVAAIVCAVAYVGFAARDVLAAWLGSHPQLTSLERAAWLEPGNAEYRNHVGRYFDLVARDPLTAITHYKTAVQLNPHAARYWFDLASAYQVLGDTANQTSALKHAIQADSMTPDVAWEAANLYLVQGENEKALREFRVVMANDSSLASAAVQYCWRIEPDVDSLLRDVVPANVDSYIALLALLASKQETDGTFKVWNALIDTQQPIDQHYATDYFQYLIAHKEVDEALRVWEQTGSRFHFTDYMPAVGNMIVNGSFENDPLNAGLDWQHQKQAGVHLTLDPSDRHSGRRSLLIHFDGPGINDAGIFQYIPVQPNTAYEVSAFYKDGEMDGAGGPHLTVQDMYTQAVYYESDELRDAGTWKSLEGEFTTGPDCRLIVLHIRRLPAGSPIRGKLWVDDFRMVKKPS